MSLSGKRINTVDLGVGGTAASPTKTYTGIWVLAFEPIFDPMAGIRVNADGSSDSPSSPTIVSWDIEFLSNNYPDQDTPIDGVGNMEKVIAFFVNRPQFIRGNSAEWIKRHSNTTTWIPVVALGALPTRRKANLYGLKFTVRECAQIQVTAP